MKHGRVLKRRMRLERVRIPRPKRCVRPIRLVEIIRPVEPIQPKSFFSRIWCGLKKVFEYLHRKNQESILQHKQIQEMLEKHRTNYLYHIRWK